ncbi:conserved hypothetical protein [Thermotomaculum hydrothermale]|uniref:Sulphur transport domain-containing protein n=1 Tax=Thermotomaculum hydrothermale TaxID=981385 RepID=A0A7R6PG50_9BACT|nr:YeeE/YedE thiosulfate transporter family protein [Thermotomaculum hydrothermale]BBB33124.1 conserved hypothetical protein [Thermotomaculum hydrothermale]
MLEIFVLGVLFGFAIIYARLNKFETISGMATLEDLTVAKAMAFAIGLGMIILPFEIGFMLATYHVKPFILGGVVLGGILFGIGMAILGYCPGTLAISAGEGSVDAIVGIIGGLFGGLVFTLVLPSIKGILGPNFGKVYLEKIIGGQVIIFYIVAVIVGIALMALAFYLNKLEGKKDKKWLYSGIMLGILNPIVFLEVVQNRPIGASTAFPYVADKIFGLTDNPYFLKIQKPGHWEVIFLAGAIVCAFVFALIKKEFAFKYIYPRWEKTKGNSKVKRLIYAFLGGFILIFGARMAGGCTSGHILSGGMQFAISSFVFAIFVFISLLVTGRLFYKK